jgi:hypothetical protein
MRIIAQHAEVREWLVRHMLQNADQGRTFSSDIRTLERTKSPLHDLQGKPGTSRGRAAAHLNANLDGFKNVLLSVLTRCSAPTYQAFA